MTRPGATSGPVGPATVVTGPGFAGGRVAWSSDPGIPSWCIRMRPRATNTGVAELARHRDYPGGRVGKRGKTRHPIPDGAAGRSIPSSRAQHAVPLRPAPTPAVGPALRESNSILLSADV